MSDDDTPIGDALRAFGISLDIPEPTERECSGGCGVKILAPCKVWCKACLARVELAESRRAARGQIGAALRSIPREWQWATFYAPELPIRLARSNPDLEFIRERTPVNCRGGFTILGPAGCGKTSIACALLRRFLDADSVDVTERIRSRFASSREVPDLQPDPARDLRSVPVLVLDDVGAEIDTATGRSAISDLLAYRHAWELPTIVTTWLNHTAIATRYGDGIARRLFEHALEIRFE